MSDPPTTPTRFVGLVYHDVHAGGDDGAGHPYGRLSPSAVMYHVGETAFARQLDVIARCGARALDLDDVRRSCATSGANTAGRGVVICFDDGWQGAVTRAASLLDARGWPAFFFITTNFLGKPFFARPEELRRLDPARFTVGSHGATHRMLSALTTAQIRTELRESRQRLEDLLGRGVVTFSIPGGAVDRRVLELAREAGYSEVFTSTIGVNPTPRGRFDIARVGITRTTSDEELGRWLSFRLQRERWRKAALEFPKRLLGMRRYTRVRRLLLGDRGHEHHFEP